MEPILYVADRTYFECINFTALLLHKDKGKEKKGTKAHSVHVKNQTQNGAISTVKHYNSGVMMLS